jgi:membrane protein DedA with SNARE-associated domain
VEGTTAALVAGFFISTGALGFSLSYIALLLGDLIPDAFLYYVGRHGNKKRFLSKYGPKIGIHVNAEEELNHLWSKHDGKIFVIGKLAYGLAVPLLISAGLAKYDFRKYLAYCTLVSGIKVLIVLLVGYYLGNSYKNASQYFDYFYIVIAVIFIIIAISYFFFTKKMRQKFQELEKAEGIR